MNEVLTTNLNSNFNQSPSAPINKGRNEELWKVSKGFESIFYRYMYKAMRKGSFHSEVTKPSTGRQIFTEMLDGEYSKLSAGKMSGGLADVIYNYLERTKPDGLPVVPRLPQDIEFSHPARNVQKSYKQWPSFNGSIQNIIEKASKVYEVDSNLIRSVVFAESAYNPKAISKAGAKGLMQLMDPTARELGVTDSFNPYQNVMGGTKYLKQLLTKYKGDEELALAAYNAGPSKVAYYGGIPPYDETQKYVKKVLAYREKLQERQKGGTDASNP